LLELHSLKIRIFGEFGKITLRLYQLQDKNNV